MDFSELKKENPEMPQPESPPDPFPETTAFAESREDLISYYEDLQKNLIIVLTPSGNESTVPKELDGRPTKIQRMTQIRLFNE